MTKTADAIVTALSAGPATARDLSQRLHGIDYANVRQILSRLAKAGAVTKLARGLYAVGAEQRVATKPIVTPPRRIPAPWTDDEVRRTVAAAWANFHAMDDKDDPRAWA